jgi:hypothetical protein
MANVDAPFGLRAIRNLMGKTPALREYTCDAGGSNIYEGSIVYVIAGTGTDDEVVDIWDGTTDVPLLGVAAHKRLTADSERTLAVYVDVDQEYEVQVDDGSLTHESDYVGSHFTVTNATGGTAATNQSITEVTGASGQAAADADNVLLGVSKSRDPEVDYTTANPTIIVKIAHARHIFGSDGGVA